MDQWRWPLINQVDNQWKNKQTNIGKVCVLVEWICSPCLPYHGTHKGVVYFEFFKNSFNDLIGYQDVIHLNEYISLKSKCCSLAGSLVLRISSRCLNTLYDMLLFCLLPGIFYNILWFNIITTTYIFTVSLFTSMQDGPNSFSIYMK